MKRIFTLLIFTFLGFSSFAAAVNAGRLTITGARNITLSVIVDDRLYERVTGAITLDDLAAGYHQVKVYEVKSHNRNSRRGDRPKMIYSSRILIKPYHHVSLAIRALGQVDIVEQQISQRGRDRYPHNDGRWNEGRPGNSYQPMSERMLQSAKQAIRSEAFDKDKANMAKQIISNSVLHTSQVKEIMELFSFDDSKLDFAKYAYTRTADKNNYFTLYDMFAFRKNKEELMNYISQSNVNQGYR